MKYVILITGASSGFGALTSRRLAEEQERIANETIADVKASGLWPGKVVTEVKPASDFWEAEPEHQDYLQRYPHGYTYHFARPNWKLLTGKVEQART